MNIFQSFVPSKRKVLDETVIKDSNVATKKKQSKTNSKQNTSKHLSSVSCLLSAVNSESINLTVSRGGTTTAPASKDEKKLPFKEKRELLEKQSLQELINNHDDERNMLYSQLHIESNFDITSMVYPHRIHRSNCTATAAATAVDHHLLESDLYIHPIQSMNTTLHNQHGILEELQQYTKLDYFWNLQKPDKNEVSIIMKRFLKWQESFYSALNILEREYQNIHNDYNYLSKLKLYLLGEALMPSSSSSSSLRRHSISGIFYIHSNNSSSIMLSCLLIGIKKSFLKRLYKYCDKNCIHLLSKKHYHDDIFHLDEVDKVDDPHMSTTGRLTNNLSGYDVIITGQKNIRIVADIIIENVFSFMKGSIISFTDVPILISSYSFLHSKKEQLEYHINSLQYLNDNKMKKSNKVVKYSITIHGFMSSITILNIIKQLIQLQREQQNHNNQKTNFNYSDAYDYLEIKQEASSGQMNIPTKYQVKHSTDSTGSSSSTTALLNPMEVIPVASRKQNEQDSTLAMNSEVGRDNDSSTEIFNSSDSVISVCPTFTVSLVAKNQLSEKASLLSYISSTRGELIKNDAVIWEKVMWESSSATESDCEKELIDIQTLRKQPLYVSKVKCQQKENESELQPSICDSKDVAVSVKRSEDADGVVLQPIKQYDIFVETRPM